MIKRLGKKGYVQDFLFLGIVVFILIIIVVIGGKLNDDFNTDYQDRSASAESKAISQSISDRYNTIFDWIFFSVFIIFALSIIASMFMLDTHPVLFFVVIIIFGFILIVMAILGNTYEVFKDNPSVSNYAAQLPVADWIMTNWVIAIMVFGFMGIIALFAKMRVGTFR